VKKFEIIFLILIIVIIGLSACKNNAVQTNNIESSVVSTEKIHDDILIEQIKSGDFSNVIELDEDMKKTLDHIYTLEKESQNIEWIERDLNENGLKGLIWQEKNYLNSEAKRIVAIFALINNEVKLSFIHLVEIGRIHFISKNGNIIYHYYFYGQTRMDSYYLITFNDDGNMERSHVLLINNIYDLSELPDDWAEMNPDMTEVGIYFRKSTIIDENEVWHNEELTEEQFLEAFEEMTGWYYLDSPWIPGWYDFHL